MEFKHPLGATATDRVTGFTGVITARAEHLTGCNTYGLVAKAGQDGKIDDPRWFDEQRLTLESVPRVVLGNEQNGAGPNPVSTRTVGR